MPLWLRQEIQKVLRDRRLKRDHNVISPKQDGAALNYFVYPYVEVDGKPYDKLDKQFSFEELKSEMVRAVPGPSMP